MVAIRNILNKPEDSLKKDSVDNLKRDRRQPEYEKIEVERHLGTCAKVILKIFPFFKM